MPGLELAGGLGGSGGRVRPQYYARVACTGAETFAGVQKGAKRSWKGRINPKLGGTIPTHASARGFVRDGLGLYREPAAGELSQSINPIARGLLRDEDKTFGPRLARSLSLSPLFLVALSFACSFDTYRAITRPTARLSSCCQSTAASWRTPTADPIDSLSLASSSSVSRDTTALAPAQKYGQRHIHTRRVHGRQL